MPHDEVVRRKRAWEEKEEEAKRREAARVKVLEEREKNHRRGERRKASRQAARKEVSYKRVSVSYLAQTHTDAICSGFSNDTIKHFMQVFMEYSAYGLEFQL